MVSSGRSVLRVGRAAQVCPAACARARTGGGHGRRAGARARGRLGGRARRCERVAWAACAVQQER